MGSTFKTNTKEEKSARGWEEKKQKKKKSKNCDFNSTNFISHICFSRTMFAWLHSL